MTEPTQTPTPTPDPTPTPTNTPGPTSTPAPSPDPQPSFIETLGDDFKGNDAFKDIADAKTLAQKYLEQGKTIGELQAKIPKAPESPDKYSEVKPPEGVILNDDALKGFNALAHKLNMSDNLRTEVLKYQFEVIKAQNEAIKKQHTETMAELKKELGGKFDESLAAANKVAAAIPELKAIMGEPDASGQFAIVRNNPNFFKALVALGQKIQVDRLPNTPNQSGGEQPKGPDGRPVLSYPSMQKK